MNPNPSSDMPQSPVAEWDSLRSSGEEYRERLLRLTQRGRAMSDLQVMAIRERIRSIVITAVASTVGATLLTLLFGGPWPLLFTIPAVLVVLVMGTGRAWPALMPVVGVAIVLGAQPAWMLGVTAAALVFRRRWVWAVRQSRPWSLARYTPLYVLVRAGLRQGVSLRFALVRIRVGTGTAEPLLKYVLQQPRRRGDNACRAAAHLGLAVLARQAADITSGLDHAERGAVLLHQSRPRRLADRLAFETGRLMHDGARHAEAVDPLVGVAKRMQHRGDRKGANLALNIAAASATVANPSKGIQIVFAAREGAKRSLDLQGLIRTELLLAQIAIAGNDSELARSAAESTLELAKDSAKWYENTAEDFWGAVTEQAAAQGGAHLVLARVAVGSGDDEEALEHATEAIRLCDAVGRSQDVTTAELIAAEIRERQGLSSAALGHALTAVANIDRARYLLPTPRWRADWASGNEAAYGMALRLAAARGDGRLVAELVESARLQAVPQIRGDDSDTLGSLSHQILPNVAMEPPAPGPVDISFRSPDLAALRTAAAQAALGADPLQPAPVLVSDGHRLLPRADVTAGRLVVDIAGGVARLAGEDAWWWGAAFADGVYYWAVRGEAGYSCGRVEAGPGSAARKALNELISATPGPGFQEQNASGVLMGPLAGRRISADDPRTLEAALSWRLAGGYLPEPIRQLALRSLEGRQRSPDALPPRLVVSLPAALSRLPAAMLALREPVPGPGGFNDAPRLVEACIIHHAPSMALLAGIGQRAPVARPSADRPWPLSVAIVDPTDDLKHAHGGDEPDVVLTGWQRLSDRGHPGTAPKAPATKAELRRALLKLQDRARLLTFAGHAHPGHPDAPATGGLVLAKPELSERHIEQADVDAARSGAEQLLTARELLTRDAESAAYPFPARVLLSACSASGYGALSEPTPGLAGEWLGVAAAVLHAGADEVVATLFDVIDTRATTRFERRLITLLMSSPDAASALRQIQMESLTEWRRNRRMPPLIWAAYVCLGGGQPASHAYAQAARLD
jgi:hypothetical protein